MQKTILFAFFIIAILSVIVPTLSSYASSPNTTITAKIKCLNNYDNVTLTISNATITYPYDELNTYNGVGFLIHNSTNGKITLYVPPNLRSFYGPDIILLANGTERTLDLDILNASTGLLTRNLPHESLEFELAMLGPSENNGARCSVVPEFSLSVMMIITASLIGAILIQRQFRD